MAHLWRRPNKSLCWIAFCAPYHSDYRPQQAGLRRNVREIRIGARVLERIARLPEPSLETVEDLWFVCLLVCTACHARCQSNCSLRSSRSSLLQLMSDCRTTKH